MNRIAESAGVSIKTLYRHFQTKDELFSAVMQAACSPAGDAEGDGGDAMQDPPWFSEPPSAALVLAGEDYLRHVLSPEQLALYRVVTRDASRFPELGRRYRDEVVGRSKAIFAAYLDRWLPRTGWAVADKQAAAAAFAGLLKAGLFDEALHGIRRPDDEEISRQARRVAARTVALLEAGLF